MKTNHLNPDELTGYVYRTLDDAQREKLDAHLSGCPSCRANLTQQEFRQRQISIGLSGLLNTVAPSPDMGFAAIAPRLQSPGASVKLWPQMAALAPLAVALLGLFFAGLGLWRAMGDGAFSLSRPIQPMGTLPTLAGFCLALVSVQQFDHPFTLRPRWIVVWLVAAILWAGTAILGLLNLVVLRDLAFLLVIALDGIHAQAGPVAIMAVMFGAMLYISLVIGGAEYHIQNIGQPGSWKLFSVTLLGQLFLLVLPYLLL